jgi:U32 family peptidase
MTTNLKIPEIVAPAGSMETFSTALNAGADAVYVGIKDFNMRVGAFSADTHNLKEMTKKAHDKNVRMYLALNTIIYNNELSALSHILDESADSGADAIILWDMAALNLAKERSLNIHLSTQASVSNIEAVRFYSSIGVKRIVLARELSIKQISLIIKESTELNLKTEFECFVHGAMCVAVSGRCLTSQFLHQRSANKGDCLQPCRRKYKIYDYERGHELIVENDTILSAKDLCTIDIIDKIIMTGIDAMKIEGRMRDERYVKTVIECYKEARDAFFDGSFTKELSEKLTYRLEKVFTRGFSHGFYEKRPDFDFSDSEGNISTTVKKYAGKVMNFYKNSSAADIFLEASELSKGQEILITGPTTGAVEFTVISIRNENNCEIEKAEKGCIIGIKTPSLVREGDKVYIIEERNT